MAGPVAIQGSLHTCPMCSGTTPHVGGPIVQGAANVLINGKPVATIGSICTCVGPPDTIVTGNPSILINGIPIACMGDMSAHGGVITSGENNVIISSNSPTTPKAVMPIDKIPFPKITIVDRIKTVTVGQGKNLKTAEQQQQKVKELAEKQEEEQKDKEKKLPKLQGEIIFVNGYLSDVITNSESHYNAIMDKNPDKSNENAGTLTGENVDEANKISQDDIYTQEEFERDNNTTQLRRNLIEYAYNYQNKKLFENHIFKTPYGKYYGYWNLKANKFKGTETYANYFNAAGRIHYINGSHGLGSSGAHRIDHGIALGYEWARYNWNIYLKEAVDAKKEEQPEIESHAPHYKPVTIVGHSQGACMAAGVKLGIIKYANEMGWDKVAVNSIFLGVHQPQGLYSKEYDKLIRVKTKQYLVNQNVLYFGKEEDSGIKFLSKISALYDSKYKKLYNERGLFEHVKAICSDWSAYKSRAVQFTFSNDRGDLVTRDGDIPEIKSACHPKTDQTLFSAEYFFNQENIPKYYQTSQDKEIIYLSNYGATGGCIVIPPYIANRRFDFEDVDEKSTLKEQEYGKEWGKYKDVSIAWGVAMHQFTKARKAYENDFNVTFKHEFNIIIEQKNLYEWTTKMEQQLKKLGSTILDWEEDFFNWMQVPKSVSTRSALNKNQVIRYNRVVYYYRAMLLKYAALQTADLYAHFGPVALINHKKILSDIPEDEYGKISILDRIKNAGKNQFYRVVYDGNESKLSDEEKREQENKYVETPALGKKYLIDTSLANTPYINNVLQAYVFNSKKHESKLYDEEKHKH